MSELEEDENKLSAVILQVQEGKTSVCINYITNDTSKLHIVITMNTLKSGMQFFGRLIEVIDLKNIIVFNSDKTTADGCNHAKDIGSIMMILNNNPNIKVIICCAHEIRFKKSIHGLLKLMYDSITLSRKKIDIHIDEGHVYIKQNRQDIVRFNSNNLVKDIIGYSGTPFAMWGTKKDDPLFYKLPVRDIKKELGIIRSSEYFGSRSCEFFIMEEQISDSELIENIDNIISTVVSVRAGMDKTKPNTFYGNDYHFNFGNELLLFGYLKFILPKLNIEPNTFSYHFVPAYNRIVTHYQVVEIILECYPTSNVIISNRNGTALYRIDPMSNKSYRVITDIQILQSATHSEKKKLREPSYMIQQLIKKTKGFPTWVSGFMLVNMSVTLIDQYIGNFDTCIMDHRHLHKEKLRQLQRQNFNYERWSTENKAKIKTTKVYSFTKSVVDHILQYENDVERIISECSGKSCTLREIQGFGPEEPTLQEIKVTNLNSIKILNSSLWKKFKVYDGNDNEQWQKATNFYEDIKNKKLSMRSKPRFVDNFWLCSTTSHVKKQSVRNIVNLQKQSWWSTFQLVEDQFVYARMFVGYDDINDPTEYTIFIKHVMLEDNQETKNIIKKYSKTKSFIDKSSNFISDEEN
jgi:hypothetical protein